MDELEKFDETKIRFATASDREVINLVPRAFLFFVGAVALA